MYICIVTNVYLCNMKRYFDSNDILCIDLKKFDLFKDLTEPELQEIEDNIKLSKQKRGTLIYSQGSEISGVYIVINGILKIFKTGAEGKDQIIRFAKMGDPVGFRSVMTDERACTSVESLTESTVCFIPKESILKLYASNSLFSKTMLRILCRELGDANDKILNLAQKTVRERLAEAILSLMDAFDLDEEQRLRIALTREDLANLVGTATESIIRLLSEFKHDKLIEIQGRYIKLLNVQQLIKVANIRV